MSISLPVYSDPYYGYDFKTYRSENMDWISYLLNSTKSQDDDISISEVSSFTWQINASYSPKLPEFFKPYLSSLSMSLKSSVNFSTKNTVFKEKVDGEQVYYYDNENYPEIWTSYTPQRRFYYPSYINPANVNLSMSGTLFSWPVPVKSSNKKNVSFPMTLNKPDELKSQSQIDKENEEKKKKEET